MVCSWVRFHRNERQTLLLSTPKMHSVSLESQKEPREVSSPTSCSKQTPHRIQTGALPSQSLNTSKDGDPVTALAPLSSKKLPKILSRPPHGHISTWFSFLIHCFPLGAFFGLVEIVRSQDHQLLHGTTLYISLLG